jgi:hypothetical protein
MRNLDDVFPALARSAFRARFHLRGPDRDYIDKKGLDTVVTHARDLLSKRLAPAEPKNDGKQTPFRGHPVFIAQHATATCCRGCLEKWYDTSRGRELTDAELDHAVAAITRWLRMELSTP